jgi:hypothetical protein
MINFPKTVDAKPVIDKDGDSIIDLTSQVLKNDDFIINDICVVPDDFTMRPDLVVKVKYGDISKLEILLKANEISNPFTIEGGDVLILPDVNNIDNFISKSEKEENPSNIIRKQYNKMSNKSNIINKGDTISNYENQSKLPPNYAKEGDVELMFTEDGGIILGPNVTEKTIDDDMPLSKEKLISKIKKLK